MKKQKIIVIVGQTSVGKSGLAVRLAKKFKAEIISADSRQIYRGLDISSGKIPKKEQWSIPHWMLDIVPVKKIYSVSDFQKGAQEALSKINENNHIAIVVGGTGFYIDSLIHGVNFPSVPPNKKLRDTLSKKTSNELFVLLEKINPIRASAIDKYNKIRLIRALEIANALGAIPPIVRKSPYDVLWIGLTLSEDELKDVIAKRTRKRLKQGMVKEIQTIHKGGVSWKRLKSIGFDQKFTSLYLEKKISKEEMIHALIQSNWAYAKRQETWFKKNKKINWFDSKKIKNHEIIEALVSNFLK